MKKGLKITLLALSIFGMTACGETPATSDAPATSSTAQETSSVSVKTYDAATVQFVSTVTEVEKGDTQKIRIRVTTEGDDKTATFSCDQEGSIISFETEVSGVTSVTIKGLALGEATIKATSTVNPTAYAEMKITVTPVMPVLSKAYRKMIENNNYTITSYELDDDGEQGEVHQVTKVTENAVIMTDAEGKGLVDLGDDYPTIMGFAVDPANDVYYLGKDNTGYSIVSSAYRIQGTGLLSGDAFLGLGDSASSPNDVGTFYGYQAISPKWLSSKKSDSENNVYTIDHEDTSSDKSYYSAWVEYLAWNLCDITSWMNASATSWFTLADAIDTEFIVVGTSQVNIEVTVEDTTYRAVISDIGSTELDEDAESFIINEENIAPKPALCQDFQLLQEGLSSNIYELTEYGYITKDNYSTYKEISWNVYLTPNYVWVEYPEETRTIYEEYMGEALDYEDSGLIAMADGIYYLTVTPATYTTEGTLETPAVANVGDIAVDNTNDLPAAYGYLSQVDALYGDAMYAFYDDKEEIFTGYPSSYYTYDTTLLEELYYVFTGYTVSSNYSYFMMVSVVTGLGGEDGKSTVATGGEFDIAYTSDGQYYGIDQYQVTHINDIDDSVFPYHSIFTAASTYTDANKF